MTDSTTHLRRRLRRLTKLRAWAGALAERDEWRAERHSHHSEGRYRLLLAVNTRLRRALALREEECRALRLLAAAQQQEVEGVVMWRRRLRLLLAGRRPNPQ